MPGNEDRVGYWLTPPDLMAELQAEFDFNFDSAPYPRPAGFDGLKEPWGKRTWCNPPFNRAERGSTGYTAWARKALAERDMGKTVVCIFPIRVWLHLFLEAGAEIRLLGPVEWEKPDGSKIHHAQNQALFILRPKP